MHATADSAKYCRDAWLNVERLCSRSVSYGIDAFALVFPHA